MSTTLVSDTATVMSRELRPLLRDPFTMVFSMVQPLVFLGLFAPLLPDVVAGESALQWFVPGIVVMSCLFGTSMTGSNLLYEIQTGSHERMLVTPLRRPALLIGRALKEIVPMFAQAVLIVCVTIPFGFDLHAAGTLLGLVILAAFCIGVGALSYTLALASKNQEWLFWTVQQTLLFPVLLLAGMLLPVDNGPGWLQNVVEVQSPHVRRERRTRTLQRRRHLLGRPARHRGRRRRRRARVVRRHPRHAPLRLNAPLRTDITRTCRQVRQRWSRALARRAAGRVCRTRIPDADTGRRAGRRAVRRSGVRRGPAEGRFVGVS